MKIRNETQELAIQHQAGSRDEVVTRVLPRHVRRRSVCEDVISPPRAGRKDGRSCIHRIYYMATQSRGTGDTLSH